MKIRNGFVSNSSSSSFVVIRKNLKTNEKPIGIRKEKKLLEFGFRKTTVWYADQVPAFYDSVKWKDEEIAVSEIKADDIFGYNYGYEVTCNQDDVISFLIKNKISFSGNCQYGHENVIYDSTANKVVIAQNYGSIIEMYGLDLAEDYKDSKAVVIMTGEEWLKKYDYE